MIPWIVIFTTLVIAPSGAVSVTTTTARFNTEEACRAVARDYTGRRPIEGDNLVLLSARCYQD